MNDTEFLVCVRCMTFNHANYISQALDGFCMQETTFPFVCIIMDDASTDGEQNVIRKYLHANFDLENSSIAKSEATDDYESIYARHKSNHNCYFAVYFLNYNHYSIKKSKMPYISYYTETSKYVALCEGDDYWVDPTKLQKQVDFMETHPDYTLCFHKVECKVEGERKWEDHFGHLESREYSKEEFMKRWTVPTCSMLYMRWIVDKVPYNKKFTMGDNVIVATCLTYGKMYCIGDSMGIYRLSPSGWNGSQSDKKKCYLQISHLKGMREEFPFFLCTTIDEYMQKQYFGLLYVLYTNRERQEFKKMLADYEYYLGRNKYRFYYYLIKRRISSLVKN